MRYLLIGCENDELIGKTVQPSPILCGPGHVIYAVGDRDDISALLDGDRRAKETAEEVAGPALSRFIGLMLDALPSTDVKSAPLEGILELILTLTLERRDSLRAIAMAMREYATYLSVKDEMIPASAAAERLREWANKLDEERNR